MPGNLIIPIAFVAMFSLLLWCIIDTRGKWWVKLILIILVLGFSLPIWQSLESYRGWPTLADPPDKTILLWALMEEPSKDDPGAIYVWLAPYEKPNEQEGWFGYSPRPQEPRAYRMPYTRNRHEQLEKANEMIRQGKIVVLDLTKPGKGGSGQPGEDGRTGGTDRNRGEGGSGEAGFQLYPLPSPAIPKK